MARPDTAEPRAKTLLGSLRATSAKCCLCRNLVLKSGWCDTCNCWPITLYPVRWCENGHRLDPDGFCWTCHDYFATQLLPAKGAWEDTGYVPKLLSREENGRRMRKLVAELPGFSMPRIPVVAGDGPLVNDPTPTQLPREVLDRQKAVLRDMAGRPVQEEVPF